MANREVFDEILRTFKLNANKDIFNVVKSDGEFEKITCLEIFERIAHYDEILMKFRHSVCVIYHTFDVKFIGFVLSALKNDIKILIRRMTLIDAGELYSDLEILEKDIPVDIVFSDLPIHEKFDSPSSELFLVHENFFNVSPNFDFIQYSSGSTKTSAGFCLTLDALLESAYHVSDVNEISSKSICASYLTLSHIYGFVTGFLVPLLSGAKSYHFSTTIVKNNPEILLDVTESQKISHIFAIMKTLEAALKNKTRRWNLQSLFCVSVGGEKLNYNLYTKIKRLLAELGMNPFGLVNSYGMSELGALTMESPLYGNSEIEFAGQRFLAVGDSGYKDLLIKVFDEDKNELPEEMEGAVGIFSPQVADFYFSARNLNKVKKYDLFEKKYYFNGDCGFSAGGKIYISGRKLNTIVYNGLKISDSLFNEFIKNELSMLGVEIRDCLVFNLPDRVDIVICYLNCESVDKNILDILKLKIKKDLHVEIYKFFSMPYKSTGIEKISLPKVVEMYKKYVES